MRIAMERPGLTPLTSGAPGNANDLCVCMVSHDMNGESNMEVDLFEICFFERA